MPPHPLILWIAGLLVGAAFVLAIVRLVRGPDAVDRVAAIDLVAGTFLCLVLLRAIRSGDENYLSVAMAIAVISFAGTVALARYLESTTGQDRSGREDQEGEDQ